MSQTKPAPKRNRSPASRKLEATVVQNGREANEAGRHAPKLAAGIAQDIELHIIRLGWPVGEVIFSEAELMQRYQASRAIVREAVSLLEQHTTARMRRGPKGGLMVCAPDPDAVTGAVAIYLEYQNVTPAQLAEARVALELSAVELAASRLTEEGIVELRSVLDAEQGHPEGMWWEHTRDVHIAIARLTGNPTYPLFITVLAKLVDARAKPPLPSETMMPEVHCAHSKIVDAIVAGDASLARHRMHRHLEAITPLLDDRSGSPPPESAPPDRPTHPIGSGSLSDTASERPAAVPPF